MAKDMEIEYIGKISKEKFEELKEKFGAEGKAKKNKQRISFMYFRDKIPADLEEIKDEDTDLRLRVTDVKPEVIVKKGLFTGSHARKETSIEFPIEKIEDYVDFLSSLGWNLGVIYATETFVFEYKGIEFSLVEIKDYGYNFEAEILTNEENEIKAREKILEELKKLGLEAFDEKGLNKQCNNINNRKELQFDFSKQSFNQVRERFEEYFD